MYFRNYGLRKTWLDKYLKTPVSEDLSTSNLGNESKHYRNLNESTFTIFIENNWVGKSLSKCYADDKYSLLIKDNLTQPSQMQLSYKQKTFYQPFSGFLKVRLSFEDFQEKDNPQIWCIS